jgi:hypothetical protein
VSGYDKSAIAAFDKSHEHRLSDLGNEARFHLRPSLGLMTVPRPAPESANNRERGILALIVTYTLGQAARAEGTVPTQFVIGYDDEVSSSSFIANVVDLIHPRYFPLLASASQTKPARPQENDAEVRDLL